MIACSGFITKDPLDLSHGQTKGRVCAGFRQCGSRKGVAGGAAWDVPLVRFGFYRGFVRPAGCAEAKFNAILLVCGYISCTRMQNIN